MLRTLTVASLLILFLPLSARSDHGVPAADPVTLDEACAAEAPAGGEAFCDAVQAATGQARAQCESQDADSGFCALFGGNAYSVVQACYYHGTTQFGEEARRICKSADVVVSATAAYCRQIPGTPPTFCALFSSDLIDEAELRRYEDSWVHRAHILQREHSATQPMRHTMYVATHNSYNATTENTPPTLSGSDANQRYGLTDQLRMDIRGLELDVHWMPAPTDGKFRATVCHGNVQHAGCSYERSLRSVLTELATWLEANPAEVIVIDLENHLNEPLDASTSATRHAEASADVWETIGARLFTPAMPYGRSGAVAPACGEGQPLEVSIAEVRAAGRQVILYSGGECNYEHQGQPLAFSRDGTHLQDGAGSYFGLAAPDSCRFSPEEIDTRWVRLYEDGTFVGTQAGAARQAGINEVREMARCNINMPSLDHVLPFDGRLEAFLWSWDQDQPAAIATPGRSPMRVVQNARGRWETSATGAGRTGTRYLACLNPAEPLVAANGSFNPRRWRAMAEQCTAPYQHATPLNGLENTLLQRAKEALGGVQRVLLRLTVPAGD